MTKVERLGKAGQMRIPGIEIMVDRFFCGVRMVAARALKAVLRATRTLITARVAGDLLTLGGELRTEYTQESVEDLIDGLNEEDAYTALIGLGFEERLHFAH